MLKKMATLCSPLLNDERINYLSQMKCTVSLIHQCGLYWHADHMCTMESVLKTIKHILVIRCEYKYNCRIY